jgi:hypothetical protein
MYVYSANAGIARKNMILEITDNKFNPTPWITWSIDDEYVLKENMNFFDKDGYELNPMEKKWYMYSGINISEKHLWHTCNQIWWIKDLENSEVGCVVDHSILITRYGYAGSAREQLLRLRSQRPILNKLLSIKPKWGIDFSLDWISTDECTELFHIEYDAIEYEDMLEKKSHAEKIIMNTDWQDGAKKILAKRSEWDSLNSDDQSDYKARYFGWHRAFDNKKVFAIT